MARVSGLSAKALRVYHDNGLLVPARVDPHTGYRFYADAQVGRARRIAMLRRLGMPLSLIATVLDADAGLADQLVLRWWRDQERSHARVRLELERVIGSSDGPPSWSAPVRRRSVPERMVASISRLVDQSDLVPRFTQDSFALRDHVNEAAAEADPGFWVIYHDPIAPGSPGRIETCVPYRGTVSPVGEITLRAEPAGVEIYTPVRAADCRYPQILAAFGAVLGQTAAGDRDRPPRELYYGAWSEDPEAEVAEVVLPVNPPGHEVLTSPLGQTSP